MGGLSVPPKVLKEAVDYAYSKGVLLVGSAGNQNTDQPHYPDAYENVMAVAGTDRDDKKAGFSNFGERIDVCAPGYATTTALNGKYTSSSGGTSYSAPYVSGLAALLFSHYPRLTNAHVRQIIKATADNIDSLNSNYRGKLGAGRINCYRALTEKVNVSIVTTITESGTTYLTTITTAIPEFSDAGMVLAFTLTSALVMGRRKNKNRLR